MHKDLEIINNPMVVIGRKCINSEDDYTVSVSLNSFIKYLNGEPLRRAFPNLRKSDWEFLERGVSPIVEETFKVEVD